MFDAVTPDDLAQLPADAYWHLVHTLRLTLPPPLSDTQEDLARRDHAALARIAGLAPANAAEAELAAQFVAASEQWKDCLRLSQGPRTTPEWAARCRAQAIAMMRQANGALRLLLRLQAARGKLESDQAASDRAAWTEHRALRLMAQALRSLAAQPGPPAKPAPPAPEPQPPRAEPAPAAAPGSLCGGAGEGPGDGRQLDLLAAAERYAAAYPERAAFMRRTRKLPGGEVVYFDPPGSGARTGRDGRPHPGPGRARLIPSRRNSRSACIACTMVMRPAALSLSRLRERAG